MTNLLFCTDPFDVKLVDEPYRIEAEAARFAGFEIALLDFDALVLDNNPMRAVRRVAEQFEPTQCIYRGWMLSVEQYAVLFDALAKKNIELINDVNRYRECHEFPSAYDVIREHTPRSVWISNDEIDQPGRIVQAALAFGNAPLIVKDFVKSRKHEWEEACFIPSAHDHEVLERIVRTFIERQAESLTGGVVLREFVELEPIGSHSKSGMPLTKEFRIFFLDGAPLLIEHYWEEGEYGTTRDVPMDQFINVARCLESRFFTMDIACTKRGEWLIIELGDGQVAGLPERALPAEFYAALKTALR